MPKVNGKLWQSGLCVTVRERGSSRCGNTHRSPLHVRVLPSPPVAAADARKATAQHRKEIGMAAPGESLRQNALGSDLRFEPVLYICQAIALCHSFGSLLRPPQQPFFPPAIRDVRTKDSMGYSEAIC